MPSLVRKVRVYGMVTVPVWIDMEVPVNAEDDRDEQDEVIKDVAFDKIRGKLVSFAAGGIGFQPSAKAQIGTPIEYVDNLTFDTIEDRP